MVYTGHRQTKMADGKTLVEWIKPILEDEAVRYEVSMPTDKQIALVISAVRMHTIIMHAGNYDFSELGKTQEVTKFWPVESSIGRYFRDAARETLEASHEQ